MMFEIAFAASSLASIILAVYFHRRLNTILAHVKAEDAALLALAEKADAKVHADVTKLIDEAKPVFLKVKGAAYATCSQCKMLVARFEIDASGLAHCLNCLTPKGRR